jgi:hypothetical protein
MLAPSQRGSDSRRIFIPAVLILVVVIVAASIWTYTTRDWNASGTQKVGSSYSTAPSEGGKPLILTK